MFEAHVLHLLRRYLGEYIHGLSSEALRISVWKGDVVLKDLKLKAEALNSLKLPVTVKAGFVGIITLKVPWKSLGKEPVIVLIDRVFVLVHPAPDTRSLNVQRDMDKLLEAKLQWIEAAESATVEAITKLKTKNSSSGNSWLGSLIATTIGNLKISITNVHIRYEDSVSHLGNPFAGGVTLAKLAAVTMDDFGNETFVTSGVLDKLRKSLQLERLAMYHDCNSDPWKVDKKWEDLSRNEWIEMFEDGITEPTSSGIKSALNRNYLISPINGVLKYHRLGNQERNDPEIPFEKACLTLDDVYLTVTENQYHDLIKLLEVVSRYRTCVEISHLRPTVPISDKPFLWWRFASQAILHKRKICYRFSWDQIKRLCQLRRHYVDVYASSLQQMADVNMSELRLIEIELDPKVILLWRLLAHAKVESLKSREALEKKRLGKRSWFSFSWRDNADNVSEDTNVEGSKAMEGGLTKEEWQEINKLLSYQPHEDFAGKEMQQMIQFLVNVSVGNAAARIISVDGTEILCGRFEQLYLSTMFKHGSTRCDVLLKFYGLSTPEGSLVQSVSSEQNVNALGASFVRSPTGENLDWKLSATILPCYVTVIVESFDRVIDFMKRSNAVSPTVALETATALQMKIEKVARKAQKQFKMVIEEKSRFCIDIDFDAPKVRVPIRISSTCESHFHLDFGHFTLHTKECPSDEEWKNIYSRCYIQGRDIAAFLTDCSSDCQDCTLLNPNYITPNSNSPTFNDIGGFYSLIDRCRMVVVLDRIKIPHPVYPSTRVSIQVPKLRIHFSPERYLRIMQLLNILYRTPVDDYSHTTEDFQNELDLWNRTDLSSVARILVWGGIGKATASWSPCFLTLSGLHLYIFDSEKSNTYQRCFSMVGKHISEIPPSNIGGSQFCVAVYTRGIDIVKALESSSTLTLEFSNEEDKSMWIKGLIQATYQASVSPAVDMLSISSDSNSVSSEPGAAYLKSADLAIRGTLAEATIILYGNGDRVVHKYDEMPILEVLANGGVVHVIQLDTDLTVKMKLHSLRILDQLCGSTSEPQYLAISVLADKSCMSPEYYNGGKTQSSIHLEEDDIFKDALSDFTYFPSPFTQSQSSEIFCCKNFGIDTDMSPASRGEFGTGNSTPGETFYEAQGVDTSDFVSLMFSTKSSWSLDYMGIDTEMNIRMSKLHFFCSRPIIVALIDFGIEINSLNSVLENYIIQNPISDECSHISGKTADNTFVKGILGSGKARVVFLLHMDIDNVTIFLNKEDGTQLAMLEQESFLLNIKVHPSCISVEGTLGNLRISDLSLGTDPCWCLLCDIRNPGTESLIMFKFDSYSPDDEDYEGYDYSLYGRLSSVHIIFLNRFVQEIVAYFTGLATPHAEEAIKLVDKVGNIELWIQKYEIDGASALKFDLSLETPLIIVPKNSMSKDFIQLDLGHLKVTNEFYWHGTPDIDPSSVHIDVLHAEILGINLAVGISGTISKPLICEGKGFDIYVRRSLRDVFRKIPTVSIEVKVGLLHAQMSDKEYSIILDCVYMNLVEEPRISVNLNGTSSGSKEALKMLIDRVNISSQTFFSDTVTVIAVEVDCALLELFNGIHGESPLAKLAIEGLWLSYRMTSLSESDLYLTIPRLSVLDIRSDTKPEMRLMLGSSTDVARPCAGLNIGSPFDRDGNEFKNYETVDSVDVPNLTMFLMDYRYRISSKSFVVRLQHPRVLVVPDFILAVGVFFVPALATITGMEETADPSNDPISKNNSIVLSTPFYEQNEDFVILSPNRQLVADSLGVDLYVYDGCGKTLCLCGEVDQKERWEKLQPIIIIGRGKTLRFVNVKIENGSLLRKYTYLNNGSSYSVSSEDGVDIALSDNLVYQGNRNGLHNNSSLGASSSFSDVGSNLMSSFTFDAQAISPEFTFYDSTKSCLDDSSHGEKLLRAKLELSFMYAWRQNDTWVRALVKDLNVEAGSGLVIIDPFDIVGGYTSVIDGSNLSLALTDVCVHLPLSVISLVLNLQAQVTQAFQSGNPSPLATCTNFDRIWVSPIDKGPGSSLTFWRPRAPPNYVILGDCVTARTMPPSQAVMAVSNIYGRVRKPLSFEFIGSLSAVQGYEADDDSTDCSLWFPIPPTGYHALGCVAHTGKLPPPCHIVYCLRSDLLTSTMASECVLCIPPNYLFDSGFSVWRLDNALGSCLARPSNDGPPRGFCYDLNSLILLKSDHFCSLENSTSAFNAEHDQCGGNDESDVVSRVSKGRSHCISTPNFERVWWDKSGAVQRRISIWRPIPQPGYGIVGDCIIEGNEPPSVGILFSDTLDVSKKPLGFTKIAQFGPNTSEVFLWYPIPPPGYVTLGYVVSKTGETPRNEIFCCPRKDLVRPANIFEVPILKSSRTSNCWSIWKVENKACTFIGSSNLEMPSSELAFSIADGDFEEAKPHDNMTAELKLRCLSVTFMDSLCGMMSPLFDITATNIKLATRGQTSTVNAVLISSIAASAFNMQLEDWEPLVEAFDAILKFETYDGNVNHPSGFGRRVRLAASSILNINISASNMDTFIQMILSWRKQSEIESKASQINMGSGKCYNKMDDSTLSALDENDFQTVVIENKLGCDVYVKKEEDHNSDEVELLKSDGCTVVWVPPPRFTNRLNVADEFREARRYVSVIIFESKGFSTADDGNGHNIFCTLRLVVGGQSFDQQKMFLQSARTKCIKPSLTETGEAVVQWNELFIFEVPTEGEAKLEVKVTNLAAKAGKGEVIGAVCLPIRYNTKILKKVASSRMISLPSETLNIVPHTLKQDEVGNDEDNLQGNGLVFISTTFFEKNKLPTFNGSTGGSSGSYGDRGVGFSIGHGPRGSWESFGSLLPLSVTPKRLEGDLFAMEVSMKNGKKHVVLRGLATVVNDSDISLDVYIDHTSKIDHRILVDSTVQNIVMEEVFENQWYRPASGWSETHTQFPGNWSTKDFSISSKEFFEPPLPTGWKWVSTWTVDKSSYVDMDGWAYGSDFQNMQWPASRFTSKSAHDTIRRRRWINTRQKCVEGSLGYNNNVFSLSPGSNAILPWKTLIKDSEQCLLIRPHVDHPHAQYSWGSAVSLASSVKDQSLISRGLLAQGHLPRQSISRREIKAPSLFILDRIEKRDMLICSAPSDERKKLWLSVCSDASVLHTGLNVPVYDWKISVNSPLKIDNRLPCEAEYMVWGRHAGNMIEMQKGVISSRECVHVYSVDVQSPIYLTLFVQGGWTLEKDPILVLDLISNNHVSSFRMIRQRDKRKLRVSIEHDLGGSIAGTKIVRLFVPYWISNDSSLSLGYRLVEVEPSPIEDSENASFPRGDKSGRMSLKKLTNTLDRRFSLSRKNYQVFEVIEDEAPVPSMLSPPDYRANNDNMMFPSSKNTASLSPRIGISVAMHGSDIYSTGISLCDLENKEIVDVNAFQSDGFYHKLSASLTMTSDRTKVIHFKPQMLFLNRIGCSVCIQQCDSYSVKWIHPTDPAKCFGWAPSPKGELLRLRLDGYNWSYPFSVPTEGIMRLSLKKEDLTHEEYVRIVVRSGAKTCHYEVIFRPNSFSSPYRIENVSMFLTMNFRQVGGPFNSWNPLPPNTAAPFFWEDLGRDRLLELLINGTDPSNSVKYNINEISDHYPIIMDGASARALHVTIMTEDKINVVRISDLMPGDDHHVSINKKFFSFEPRPSTFSGGYNASESFTTSNCEFNLIVDISELGLSLVDHTPEEILYLSIQDFQFSYLSGLDSGTNRYKLRMGGIQVDNQLPLTPMPVLFKPQRSAGNTDYILKLSAITQWNGSVDLCVYPYLGLHGPENSTFLINIHEPIIWRLHECIQHVNFGRLNDPQMTTVSVDPIINIGVLSISEFRLKVSMAMSPSQRPKGVLGFWSSLMTALGNTENMHVKINPRYGENFSKRQSALITYAVSEIQKDLLSQPLQLLSGVDILGNASSALGHMSKGVAALSMDTKFIQSRQRQDSKGVEDFGDVIREGGGALAKGFFRGVTGILTKPIEGAKSSGVEGFVQGVGKGLIGAAAQPVSGVLDLLSKTTEGANAMRMKIASAINSEGHLLRCRLPRAIGGDNLLRPYDEYKSQGQVILQLAESGFFGQVDLFRVRGKFALSDAYEDHFLLPKGKILEITHRRVVLLQKPGNGISQNKFNAASDPCVVLWDVLWGDLVTMEMACMKDDNPKAPPSCVILYSGPQSGELKDRIRVIKCAKDSNQAHEVYTSIHQALSTYGPNQSKEKGRKKKMVRPYSPLLDDTKGGDIKEGDCVWSHTQMASPSFVGGG